MATKMRVAGNRRETSIPYGPHSCRQLPDDVYHWLDVAVLIRLGLSPHNLNAQQ